EQEPVTVVGERARLNLCPPPVGLEVVEANDATFVDDVEEVPDGSVADAEDDPALPGAERPHRRTNDVDSRGGGESLTVVDHPRHLRRVERSAVQIHPARGAAREDRVPGDGAVTTVAPLPH